MGMNRLMKKTALASMMALTASAANAIELTDYVDPNSDYDEAYVNATLDAQSGNQDRTSYNANLDASYSRNYSTLPRSWGIDVRADGFSKRSGTDGEKTQKDYGFKATGNVDNYFSAANPKLFWFGAGGVESRDSADDDAFNLTVGAGYGRVFDATSLAKVLRIEEELRQHGVISGQITDDVYLAVSKIIAKEDEYKSKYKVKEYKPYWVADMEAVFKRAGVLTSGQLGALGTLKINEVLFEERISTRKHGWVARAGAGFQSADFTGIVDNDPILSFQFEYAKPNGYRGQFINTAEYRPVFGDNNVQNFSNTMSYTYEVSDKIDWENSWKFDFSQADDENDTKYVANTLNSDVIIEVSSVLDYTVGLKISDVDDSVDDNDVADDVNNDETNVSLNMGLKYRLK